jgi:ATP-dependent Clp protease ATP-binding subunit ClpB
VRVAELLANRNITIDLSRAAADRLIEEGYDPVYGARPLKRVLQRRIVDPLALQLIQGQVSDGDHVTVDVGVDGELVFNN